MVGLPALMLAHIYSGEEKSRTAGVNVVLEGVGEMLLESFG